MAFGLSVTVAASIVLVLFMILAAVGIAGLCREILGQERPVAMEAAQVSSAIFIQRGRP